MCVLPRRLLHVVEEIAPECWCELRICTLIGLWFKKLFVWLSLNLTQIFRSSWLLCKFSANAVRFVMKCVTNISNWGCVLLSKELVMQNGPGYGNLFGLIFFYYFARNSLVALLESVCARNFKWNRSYLWYPRRCKTSSIGQIAGLLILRSSVQF